MSIKELPKCSCGNPYIFTGFKQTKTTLELWGYCDYCDEEDEVVIRPLVSINIMPQQP